MESPHCELTRDGKKPFLHCKTRRNIYMIAGFVALTMLVMIGVFTLKARGDEFQNPAEGRFQAEELVGSTWLNTTGGQPIQLADRKGKVTIVHFWTFGCINCKRNLPIYNRWAKSYAGKQVEVIGVHTPETKTEADIANVRAALPKLGMTYPVLVDGEGVNWRRWHQNIWPAIYLIDKHGDVRYRWEGELEYNYQNGTRRMSDLINALLNEK